MKKKTTKQTNYPHIKLNLKQKYIFDLPYYVLMAKTYKTKNKEIIDYWLLWIYKWTFMLWNLIFGTRDKQKRKENQKHYSPVNILLR